MCRMRVPVVDQRGVPLMPCTAPKARALLKDGKARPKRNKLGLFYLQLIYAQEPNNQPLVVGIDPGSSFEGYSVVGTKKTVRHLMVEAPTHVKKAVHTRRRMRRARRFRLWRRPCRPNNRLARKHRLPPSTRSRWEAKARIVRHLASMLPLTDAAHAYKTNRRLTQRVKPTDCRLLTTIAFRCWLAPVPAGKHTTTKIGAALPPLS
jgi:hypothetical protein